MASSVKQLLVHTEENTTGCPDLDFCPNQKTETEADQLPSPEADYDKLLDVEAVPMPDGQLYLMALPPECCRGEGPEAKPYLKLFCRYITNCKVALKRPHTKHIQGVITGILLVTSNKIFFDPCKTHPLVREHGCEEYLLSCSVDNLQRKEKNIFQRFKASRSCRGSLPNHSEDPQPDSLGLCGLAGRLEQGEVESRDMQEMQWELDHSPLNLCCGGQEAANEVKTDLLQAGEAEESSVKDQTSVPQRPPAGCAGAPMFVRLRVHSCSGKRTGGGLHFGPNQPSSRRDAWLTLSQESANKLRDYLKRCRPDVQTRQGDKEAHKDSDGEELILVEDKKKEQMSQKHCSSGEDWEMVSMEYSQERPPLVTDQDPEGLHHVVESSHILEASHVRELCKELPAKNVSQTWQLTFSTSRHGASLKSLYRKLQATDSPVLIIIKDAHNEIFGAFLSHPLRPSEEFYGTGETFLFMLHPRFKCFKWTGENSFFIKGYMDSFGIGGGSGHFGLWVDENLYLGHSSPCYTFNNCRLSETNDFQVMKLEVWTFS